MPLTEQEVIELTGIAPTKIDNVSRVAFLERPEGSADDLRGDKLVFATKSEQPWHRIAAYMSAAGASVKEIADSLGKNEQYVSLILRHPLCRAIMLAEAKKCGRDEIEAMLKREAIPSLQKLIDLRDDEKSPRTLQKDCSIAILERLYGKPVAKVDVKSEVTNFDGDLKKVDAELERLQAEENRLLGKN